MVHSYAIASCAPRSCGCCQLLSRFNLINCLSWAGKNVNFPGIWLFSPQYVMNFNEQKGNISLQTSKFFQKEAFRIAHLEGLSSSHSQVLRALLFTKFMILNYIINRQYFVVMFKERPFEIWDLRSLSVLREMPANFPVVTALVCNIALIHHTSLLQKKV